MSATPYMQDVREPEPAVDRPLLLQFSASVTFAALSGWAMTPYDAGLGMIALLVFLGFALAAAFRALGVARTRKGLLPRLRPILLVTLVQPLIWCATVSTRRDVDEITDARRFRENRQLYDAVVAEAHRRRWPSKPTSARLAGQHVVIFGGEVTRVQLAQAGFFSNWEIIINDATYELGFIESPFEANGRDALRHLPGWPKIGSCWRLGGAYYRCNLG